MGITGDRSFQLTLFLSFLLILQILNAINARQSKPLSLECYEEAESKGILPVQLRLVKSVKQKNDKIQCFSRGIKIDEFVPTRAAFVSATIAQAGFVRY